MVDSFYAVKEGKEPGIYRSWAEAQAQVNGYKGAVFKKFTDLPTAEAFVAGPRLNSTRETSTLARRSTTSAAHPANGQGRKYYAVATGSSYNGIFSTWEECKQKVQEFPGAKFKKFDSRADAEGFITQNSRLTHNPKVSGISRSSQACGVTKPPSKKKPTFYAVNYRTGPSRIFRDWNSCKQAVHGQRGATYKKFDSLEDAEIFTRTIEKPNLTAQERKIVHDLYLLNNSEKNLQLQQEQSHTVIYTDGSYLRSKSGGKGGIGVFFGENDPRNISESLKDAKDSYSPEVRALSKALEVITAEIDAFEKGDGGSVFPKYLIYTDSEAATNVLNTYGKTWTAEDFARRKEGQTLRQMFTDYMKIQGFYHKNSSLFNDHVFKVTWIKGHAGHPGNEAADRLARKGADEATLR